MPRRRRTIDQPGSDEQLKADEQRRDLKEALQLGVQSAPKVEKLADEAALLLEENKPDEALPKQQEALKLLKDMLPKQQQQEQEKKDQEKKDQEKKDQDKKDQERKRTRGKKIKRRKISSRRIRKKRTRGNKTRTNKISKKKTKQKTSGNRTNNSRNKRDLSKEKAEAVLQQGPATARSIPRTGKDAGRLPVSAGKGGKGLVTEMAVPRQSLGTRENVT